MHAQSQFLRQAQHLRILTGVAMVSLAALVLTPALAGCQTAPTSPPTSPPPHVVTELAPTSGPPVLAAYPVRRDFSEGHSRAHLYNIEMLEGGSLRLNFHIAFVCIGDCPREMVARLDSPAETTFLTDQLGRQSPLVQAVGIGPQPPARVPLSSIRRFSLVFAPSPDVESFNYSTVLVMRAFYPGTPQPREWRLRINSDKEILVAEFRR